MSKYKTIFIVNPAAARGALKKSWDSLARGLKGKINKFEVGFTRGPHDATRIVSEALHDGYSLIVGVGGDGTLRECLNGFFEDGKPINPKALLGILPFGRGSDLARALGISRLPQEAMENLKGDKFKVLDVGFVKLKDKQGKEKTHYFLNNAYMGIGCLVDHWSSKFPKFAGARGAYFYGLIRGTLEYKPVVVHCETATTKNKYTIMNLVVANGPYYGAGMKAAPKAKLNDGLFDIVAIQNRPLSQAIRHMPKLYSGDYVNMPNVDYIQTQEVKITSPSKKPVWIDMDGDTVGRLPATFTLLPKAIRFKV